MSAVYIQVHFRLDFFLEANNMNPDQAAPKRYRLSKDISREERQMTKALTGRPRVMKPYSPKTIKDNIKLVIC